MNAENLNEIRALVTAGDINLDQEREKFRTKTGRDMKLTDDQLIEAIAMTDDDDTNLFVQNVLHIEDRAK